MSYEIVLRRPGKGDMTLLFEPENVVFDDDTVRKVKRKVLRAIHVSGVDTSAFYEGIYLFGYAEDSGYMSRIFRQLGTTDVAKSKILNVFPKEMNEMGELPDTVNEETLSTFLKDRQFKMMSKVAIGAMTTKEDMFFEVDPYVVFTQDTVETEALDLHYNDAWLLLNHRIQQSDHQVQSAQSDHQVQSKNKVYVCLVDDIIASLNDEVKEEYIIRHYFPQLYDKDIHSRKQLEKRKYDLIRQTKEVIETMPLDVDRAIYLLRTKFTNPVASTEGIEYVTLRICSYRKQPLQLDTVFGAIHASLLFPFIKYNPGLRRENMFRLHYEHISSDGKKIPVLSRYVVLRLARDMGKSQQIAIYVDLNQLMLSVDRTNPVVYSPIISELRHFYIYIEQTGDVVLQMAMRRPFSPEETNHAIQLVTETAFKELNPWLKSVGIEKAVYTNWFDAKIQTVQISYMLQKKAKKLLNLDSLPGIYAICTIHKERSGTEPVIRMRRVENFKEMDAVQSLIVEMYAQVHAGDLEIRDIVNALNIQYRIGEEEAMVIISDFLSGARMENGEMVEKPGFSVETRMLRDDATGQETVEFRVKGILSPFYLPAVKSYLSAIGEMTQNAKKVATVMSELKQLDATLKEEVEHEEADEYVEVNPVAVNTTGDMRSLLMKLGIFDEEEDAENDDESFETMIPMVTEEKWEEADDDYVQKWTRELEENSNTNIAKIPFVPASMEKTETEESEPPKESQPDAKSVPVESEPPKEESKGFLQTVMDVFSPSTETKTPDKSPTESSEGGPNVYSSDESKSEPTQEISPKPTQTGLSESKSEGGPVVYSSVEPSPTESSTGPIMYSSDESNTGSSPSSEPGSNPPENKPKNTFEQEINGGTIGSSNGSKSSNESVSTEIVPDGMSLLNPNPLLKRLRKRDPDLFLDKNIGKYTSYSTSCQPVSRHPVILTDAEFKKTDTNSYSHSYTYGTDPGKQHHFICPRFWCFLTNRAISETDVKAGKCGGIIPKGSKKIPKGSYVYQLGDKEQYPGFRDDAHPEGYCLPCCTQKSWDSKPQMELRQKCTSAMTKVDGEPTVDANTQLPTKKQSVIQKTANYIISLDTFPVEPTRWGYLPIPLQLFLDVDYMQVVDRNNPALISTGKTTLLRYGVDQVVDQSFLGVFAKLYSLLRTKPSSVSVAQFRDVLASAIDLDFFARAQNASLLSTFLQMGTDTVPLDPILIQKYVESTKFAKILDLNDAAQKSYLEDSIRAHQHFLSYLKNPKSKIDHLHLWDFLSIADSRLIPRGVNIVMMEITTQDMVERVELICPKSVFSSESVFDENKECVFIVKRGEFYEPIFQYDSTVSPVAIVPTFLANTLQANIRYVLKNVEHMMRRKCAPLPSLPRIYTVKPAVPLHELRQHIGSLNGSDPNNGGKIVKYVVDYYLRVIGVIVQGQHGVFVPCLPAPLEPTIPKEEVVYMDDDTIPKGYTETRDELKRFAPHLGIHPTHKIIEDGLIVGILTDTNQFVPTQPNENIANDGLRLFKSVNHFTVDKSQGISPNDETSKRVKHISLESYFYRAFQNKMRALMSKVANRGRKYAIMELVANPAQIYANKLRKIETLLHETADTHIVFVDMDDAVLKTITRSCDEPEDTDEPHCLVKENGTLMQLVLPKRHLITDKDNEQIYFGRLADDLMRNERTKRVFFDERLLNPTVESTIPIGKNEFIMVQSALTPEYFATFESEWVNYRTNYFTARPSVSTLYSSEPVKLADQLPLEPKPSEVESVDNVPVVPSAMDCVDRIVDPVGNPTTSQWRRYFPKDGTKEMVFRDTPECASEMMAHIFRESGKKGVQRQDIVSYLISAYDDLFAKSPQLLSKVVESMRKQGKSQMFESLVKRSELGVAHFKSLIQKPEYNLTDLDIWVLAKHYHLPIIIFNPNGLKGFGVKEIQWVKLYGDLESEFFFVRSNIASQANKVYEYNLVTPKLRLNMLRDGFQTMVHKTVEEGGVNVESLETRLEKIVFISKARLNQNQLKKGGTKSNGRTFGRNKRTKRRGIHYERW